MQRLLLMVRKDLLRQLRSPMSILLVLSFPLIFTTLLALTFGSGSNPGIPKVKLLVEDHDGSFLSQALLSVTNSEQMAEYFDVEQVETDGLERIEANEASALWRIPEGFQQSLLDGDPVELELIRNPAQSILPEIAEQGLTVLAEVLSASARVLREPLDELRPMLDNDQAPTAAQVANLSVTFYNTIEGAEALLTPPAITLESVQLTDEEEDETSGSGGSSRSLIFLIVLPGISVWGLFLVGDIAMRDIITESTKGTLRRQLSGPITAGQLILAKALFTAALSSISLVVLAAIGWVVGRQSVDVAGFLVLSVALILAITGFAAVVYGGVGSERQGGTISGILLLIFAFIGGSFIQVDSLPAGVQRISPISPFYWGTTGYQKLIQDGVLIDVLPNVGVLAGLGVVLLSAGAVLLRRRIAGGAA